MLSNEKLIEISKRMGMKPYQQEKHYIQTLILKAIYGKEIWVYNGGTCLFMFEGLPRFSEDLDFTINNQDENMNIKNIKKEISSLLDLYNIKNKIKDLQTKAGISFKVMAEGPLYDVPFSICSVKIDISTRNDIIEKPKSVYYNPYYEDILPFNVYKMKNKEIVAEKIRAILKRDKARDLFDLYYLLKKDVKLDLELINQKMKYYNESFDYKLLDENINKTEVFYESELKSFVFGELPKFEIVKEYIENRFRKIM